MIPKVCPVLILQRPRVAGFLPVFGVWLVWDRFWTGVGRFVSGFGPVWAGFGVVVARCWPGVEDICPEGRIYSLDDPRGMHARHYRISQGRDEGLDRTYGPLWRGRRCGCALQHTSQHVRSELQGKHTEISPRLTGDESYLAEL